MNYMMEHYKQKIIELAEKEVSESLESHTEDADCEIEAELNSVAHHYYIAGIQNGIDSMISFINTMIVRGEIQINNSEDSLNNGLRDTLN